MFCPKCGTESASELKYCRSCGANLKVIGKAVSLSEAIARSDGIPGKLKDIFSNIKIAQVTEDVSRALDKMNKEIAQSAQHRTRHGPRWLAARREKTPERRREGHLTRGFVTMFSGVGLGIFLYVLGHTVVLQLPPDVISQIPFELNSLIRVLWLLGLIPTLSGFGRILAGLSIRTTSITPVQQPLSIDPASRTFDTETIRGDQSREEQPLTFGRQAPTSVTDRTTNILQRELPKRQTDEINQ